jgi:hypothetical protein
MRERSPIATIKIVRGPPSKIKRCRAFPFSAAMAEPEARTVIAVPTVHALAFGRDILRIMLFELRLECCRKAILRK